MSEHVHLIARLVAREGQEAALAQAVAAIVPAVLEEPGCLVYTAHESRERPGTIVMYEVWESQAALDIHADATSFRALAAQFDELLDEPLAIELLRRIV
ncbi:antibiotic biosynthesis monooxygenase [Methylobacterium variabile]|uniref:Antibiotic biosynthesis monooxygenase n=1 Tax=Methylobacterium variabile TaxID=298794 RepID=A0A0J6RWQ5_9HYPH|nr:putative quinol monooxygenase [Methylobacterium variabile]KMO27285.1 antibiotic biosynthesis monooxygenase [Methylobacterium variabile]